MKRIVLLTSILLATVTGFAQEEVKAKDKGEMKFEHTRHNFGVFAEAAYTQHLMPTIIEQAAIKKGDISAPTGPLTFSIGLSLFFN